MKEKLISIETAKILHDLNISGFDEDTTVYVMWSKDCDYKTKIPFEPNVFLNGNYYEDFEYDLEEFKEVFKEDKKYLEIQFPTQSLLKKWLRETHNIGVESHHDYNPKDKGSQFYTSWGYYNGKEIGGISNVNGWYDEYNDWKKYEDALEFGLIETLKMVKSAEEKTKTTVE